MPEEALETQDVQEMKEKLEESSDGRGEDGGGERNANAWEDFRRRSHRTSCSRSSPVNSNGCLGRPVLGMPQHTILTK